METIIMSLIEALAPIAKDLISGAISPSEAQKRYDEAVAKASTDMASLKMQLKANDEAADAELHEK